MSSSLVKQSLSLFDNDLIKEPAKKKKKKTKAPMSLISTKKRGVRRELRKLQTKKKKKTLGESSYLPYNDYEAPKVCDYTDRSIEILTRISQLDSSNQNTAKTISEHHQKKKRRKSKPSKETVSKEKETASAFSDKDFEAFAKDFDFGKLKKK